MYLCAPLLGSYNPQEGVVHGCPFPLAPRRDVLTGWLRSTWQALLASTSLSRTLYSPRLCPPGPSSAFPFLCHCGFSHFIVPFKHLPLCMHRDTHTHTHLQISILSPVQTGQGEFCSECHYQECVCFSLKSAKQIFLSGEGKGRDTGPVTKRCQWGRCKKHSYLLGCGSLFPTHNRAGLGVSRLSPHPTWG